jgi:hypothetical protein
MRHAAVLMSLALASVATANAAQTFTGVITDSMCVMNHAMMNVKPESKCARDCVKSKKARYILFDGKTAYKLSDQATPEQFAAEKVKVTGTLYPKTGVIKVEKIERAK